MLLSDIYLSPRNKICTSKNKSSDDLQYRSIYRVLGEIIYRNYISYTS